MPGTSSVTVCGAAWTAAAPDRARTAISFFMEHSWSIEQRKDIGEGQRDQHQHGHEPEDRLVGGPHLRDRAHLARFALLGLPIDAAPGQAHGDERRADEERRSEERRVGKECRSRWSPY